MNLSELLIFCEKQYHVVISLEVLQVDWFQGDALTLLPDQHLHRSAVCRSHKLSSDFAICVQTKDRSKQLVRRWSRSFCGCCPFGIWDCVQPVKFEQQVVAIIYLGGFVGTPDIEAKRRIRHCAQFIAEFIAIELAQQQQKTPIHPKRRDENYYISNCQRIIETQFNEPLSLKEVANALNVSPDHLGKLIVRHCGKSFNALLNARRMEQAQVLTRLHGALKLSEIAALCGFPDSNYFSVVFKKFFGLSPKAYRQKYHK